MKIILNRDVANLGEEGDIKEVASGYARNYLLPQGLVLEDNARNLVQLEQRHADIAARKLAKREAAEDVKAKLEAEPLTIVMPAGENGRLFGSVTTATIVDALGARGVEIERKRIEVPGSTLKAVGNYKVKARLYGEQEATISVQVRAAGADDESHAQSSGDEPQAEPVGDERHAEPAGNEPQAETAVATIPDGEPQPEVD